MNKLKNGFDKLINDQLMAKADSIETHLTGNLVYADVNPTVVQLHDLNKAFTTAVADASLGNKTAMATRDELRLDLIDLMRLMANSVMAIAADDRPKLVSSGFELYKEKQSRPAIVKPAPPTLAGTGNSGEIFSLGKRQPAMIAVNHQITEYPLTAASVWKTSTSSSVKYTFTNCVPGKQYLVRQCIVGVKSQCLESEPVGYIAQ